MPTSVGTYPVFPGDPVRLEVWIGDAQEGGSSAIIEGQEVASGEPIDTSLGDGQQLGGKVLVVSTTVVDRREETDWTSATVRLSSARVTREFPQRQLAASGGMVNYLFVITFT